MYIEQIYTNCLAEAAYYIESDGEAAIIDPLRDIQPYIDLAEKRGASIKYVFETHFHADFVSGHVDLMNKTGAKIIYGPSASADYEITVAKDNEKFDLGKTQIKVLHTPGHTLESSCFLVLDENGEEHSVFTGDTLFIGDVGRPDLAVSSDVSREDLAGMLYESIKSKLQPLNAEVIMYPGHGAGSQCGKSLSKETQSTIGRQFSAERNLVATSKEDFVAQVTEGLTSPPQYFPKNAGINKSGYATSIDSIIDKSMKALSVDEFNMESEKENTIIIDSRASTEFSSGFIENSMSVGLDGFFAVWVGTLVEDLNTRILLVTDDGKEHDTIVRLARVGYENVIGYLVGGIQNWIVSHQPIEKIENCCPATFKVLSEALSIIDVRNESEYMDGHIVNAKNIPLAKLQGSIEQIDKEQYQYIYCKSGYRSIIAASILRSKGFTKIFNIRNGFDGITNKKECCDGTTK